MAARIAITIPSTDTRSALLWALETLAIANLLWLRAESGAGRRTPPVYQSGIRFRAEPQEGSGIELYQTIPEVLAQGWGDCDDITGWRVAELRSAGIDARPELLQIAPRVYHAVVRIGQTIEDAARVVRERER